MSIFVQKAQYDYVERIVQIHGLAFIRQKDSYQWVVSTLSAYPRYICYVIYVEDQIAGYIFWSQKSGFRTEVILELDQIAIHPNFQAKGLSKFLIINSLKMLDVELHQNEQIIKKILVSTSKDNFAKKLYQDVLAAKEVAVISDLFQLPEVYLISDREYLKFLDN